ncbi:MAG: ABC transporter ATP-binding protein [Pseudomonadota bacterium]
MTNRTAIEARALRRVFEQGGGQVVALDAVDIRLREGELTLLMGPSGSGKSTLISAMGGLQAPSSGAVLFRGESLWSLSERRLNQFRREHCGFVFQSGGLFPSLTALQQIAIPLTYVGMHRTKAVEKAAFALAEVGLDDREDSLPGEMSGGQNQRVAIARMLAKDPDLIFCDEPTSALDSENGAVVARLLQQTARQRDAMVLCVTHDERLVPFADRVLKIADGRIFADVDRSGNAGREGQPEAAQIQEETL